MGFEVWKGNLKFTNTRMSRKMRAECEIYIDAKKKEDMIYQLSQQ